jgi:hypothetical protein
VNREVWIHEKGSTPVDYEELRVVISDSSGFQKTRDRKKRGKTIFPNPETRIVDSRGIDLDRRIRKAVDLDLRQMGFESSDLGKKKKKKEES